MIELTMEMAYKKTEMVNPVPRPDPAMDVYLRLLTEKADEVLGQEEAAQLFDSRQDPPDTLWRLMADRLRRRAENRRKRR